MLDHELGCHIAGNGGPRRKAYDLLDGLRIIRCKGESICGGATGSIGDDYFQEARGISPSGGAEAKTTCSEIVVTVRVGPAAGGSIKRAVRIDIATSGNIRRHL